MAFPLPAEDIFPEQLKDGIGDCAHMRQTLFVPLQRGIEEDSLHTGAFAEAADNRAENIPEEAAIVFALREVPDRREELLSLGRAVATVEHRLVKSLLSSKMPENDRFRNPGGRRDFLGSDALKALAGKSIESSFEELKTAVRRSEPGSSHSSIVSKYLLHVKDKVALPWWRRRFRLRLAQFQALFSSLLAPNATQAGKMYTDFRLRPRDHLHGGVYEEQRFS